jgi:hypothetical protein
MAQNEVRLDFLADDDFDLFIQEGDFKISDALVQQAQTIILVSQGEIRYEPLIGAGASRFIGSNIGAATLQTIFAAELTKDNILLDSLVVTGEGNNRQVELKLK